VNGAGLVSLDRFLEELLAHLIRRLGRIFNPLHVKLLANFYAEAVSSLKLWTNRGQRSVGVYRGRRGVRDARYNGRGVIATNAAGGVAGVMRCHNFSRSLHPV